LHSGEFAAQEARQLLRTGRRPDQGTRMARRFTRLGSDLTLPARLAAAAPTGMSLVDDKHQPFMHRVRRVMGFGLDDNAPGATACELLALLSATYPEITPRTASDIARLNNVLALLTGQLVLTRALENGAAASRNGNASAEVGLEIATACREATEGLAAELDEG